MSASGGMSEELLLAQRFEREGRREEALAMLHKAAEAGDPHAQYFLGAWLIGSAREERPRGVKLIAAAAAQGQAQAMHLQAVLTAAGFGQEQDWPRALRWLSQAAAAGDAQAQAQVALIGENFDFSAWLSTPAPRVVFNEPHIAVIENFLDPRYCDWVVDFSRSRNMRRAAVFDATGKGGNIDPGRTNTNLYLNLTESDVIARLIKARIGAALSMPVNHQEDATVLRYTIGQTFHQHCDFLDPMNPNFVATLATFGQRVVTFLIYLSDDYDGGETDFPLLGWSFRGKKGDALLFRNTSPLGAVERQLLHAGRPPTRGEKWVFSQWVRDRRVEGIDLPMFGNGS